MSHFTTVKTQIKDLSLLNAAAKALGLQKVERNVVNGYRGQTTTAEVVYQVSESYDVGAVKNSSGTYDLVADWWGTGFVVKDLGSKLIQEYSVQTVLRRAKLMGHQVKREAQNDGTIRLVVKTR